MVCIPGGPCHCMEETADGSEFWAYAGRGLGAAVMVGVAAGVIVSLSTPVGGAIIGVFIGVLTFCIFIATLLAEEGQCYELEGTESCAAGVVIRVEQSFSDSLDQVFSFLSHHNCLDLLVTSYYWERLEEGACGVFCTGEEGDRNSEYVRCYIYDPAVCSAYNGGVAGLAVGGILGIAAGIAIAVAIGCATVILCLFAIIIGILVAIVFAVIGAIIGGHAGRASGDGGTGVLDTVALPVVGQLLMVRGNLAQSTPGGVKIFWFVNELFPYGDAITTVNDPYSYCEIDEEPMLAVGADGCSEMY